MEDLKKITLLLNSRNLTNIKLGLILAKHTEFYYSILLYYFRLCLGGQTSIQNNYKALKELQTNIKELKFYKNDYIPEELTLLKNLEILNLECRENSIKDLPNLKSTNLKRLYLNFEDIKNLTEEGTQYLISIIPLGCKIY